MWKRKTVLGAAVTSIVLLGNGLPGAAQVGAACGGDPPLPSEGLAWPVQGQVTTPWSLVCSTDRGHRGIDIDTPAGSIIKASAAGTVSFVGYTPAEGGGISVSISHPGGLRSTYLHLAKAGVLAGASVAQGDALGTSNGSPVHFGIKTAAPREAYFDPAAWLTALPAAQTPVEETQPAEAGNLVPLPVPAPDLTPAAADGQPAAPQVLAPQPMPVVSEAPAHANTQTRQMTEIAMHAPVKAVTVSILPSPPQPIDASTGPRAVTALLGPSTGVTLPAITHKASGNINTSSRQAVPPRNTVLPLAMALGLTAMLLRGKKLRNSLGAQLASLRRLKLACGATVAARSRR